MEFDFDLVSDTAMSVASEMVEEMSLSHEDAHKISLAIKEEIKALTHKGPTAADDDSSFSSSSSHQGEQDHREQDGADPSGVFRSAPGLPGSKWVRDTCIQVALTSDKAGLKTQGLT